jgi:hypothetical protein
VEALTPEVTVGKIAKIGRLAKRLPKPLRPRKIIPTVRMVNAASQNLIKARRELARIRRRNARRR